MHVSASTNHQVLAGLWIAFLAYWLVASVGVKRTVRTGSWLRGTGLRLLAIVVAMLLLRFRLVQRVVGGIGGTQAAFSNPVLGGVGIVVCALGLAVAVWARVCLGRNWGMPMTRKEGQTLVTSGPYALVRHPIYSGLLLALVGTVVVGGILGLAPVPLALFGAYFVYSARVEERLLTEQFLERYPEYQRHTKMLIPFVF
jgi:protein-S-isoprenylcysteine O-methyltransferase Ste14